MSKVKQLKFDKRTLIFSLVIIGLFLGGVIFASLILNNNDTYSSSTDTYSNYSTQSEQKDNHVVPLEANKTSGNIQTAASLEYILEEEKLAHDVYQYLYEKWGAKVFGNILKSETNHQNEVLAVMNNRSIPDSRSTETGKFNNQELQDLYDKLIIQGSQSSTEAFKVGVAIEELDINDLKNAIAILDPKDTDVKATYENLLKGSQNHIVAFNRQLTR